MPLVGVIVHDITDPYFAEIVRGVEDAAVTAGYLVITCSWSATARARRPYVRLLRQLRAAAVIFAGSGLDDPALNAELPRHVAAMRDSGAAVVHLSPPAEGEPEISVDNLGGIASMVAALVGLGPPADRLPGRARRRCTSHAPRLAGYRQGLEAAGHGVRRAPDRPDPASPPRKARAA